MKENSNNLIHNIVDYFDKLEDRIRGRLSKHPIIYAFIGSFSVALFWHAVSKIADSFEFLTAPILLLVSLIAMLMTGLFVSFFVGDSIIISGLKKEKKIVERTKEEIKTEADILNEVHQEIEQEEVSLRDLKKEIAEIKAILENLKKGK